MDFANMFGGDWNRGIMEGMRLGMMQKQMQMQQQQVQRQMANDALLNEERKLRIEEQRRQIGERNRLVEQFRPQTITKTEMVQDEAFPGDYGVVPQEKTITTTQATPLMRAFAQMYGQDKAALIGEVMQNDADLGINMLKVLKPEEGYLTAGDRVFRKTPAGLQEIVGSSKPPNTREVKRNGVIVTEQYNPTDRSWGTIGESPQWNPDKTGRETPQEAGSKVVARLQAKVEAFRQIMGREPTPQEKRAMMINDPYGLLGGEDTGAGETPAQGQQLARKKIKRIGRGKTSGKRVIEYEDGSIEYAE